MTPQASLASATPDDWRVVETTTIGPEQPWVGGEFLLRDPETKKYAGTIYLSAGGVQARVGDQQDAPRIGQVAMLSLRGASARVDWLTAQLELSLEASFEINPDSGTAIADGMIGPYEASLQLDYRGLEDLNYWHMDARSTSGDTLEIYHVFTGAGRIVTAVSGLIGPWEINPTLDLSMQVAEGGTVGRLVLAHES
jgi:hypothetical protein